MAYTLFEDQLDLVTRVRQAMRRHRAVLMQAATGAGKTAMAVDMISGAHSKGSRAWFLVPRRELLAQTIETFMAHVIPFGVISPDYSANALEPIQIGMTPTVARRLDRLAPPDVAFIDECHYGGAELEAIIEWLRARGCRIVGLSATPLKTNGRGMGEWYEHMEAGLSVAELIKHKRLSDFRYFAPSTPDLSGLRTRDGQYVKSDVEGFMESQSQIIGDAVKAYRENASGMLNAVFATSRKHMGQIIQKFRDEGIAAQGIDGTMDADQRKAVIKGFARREFTVLANVQLMTFGFDLAQAAQMPVTVECMSDLNPLKSLPMQMQKWGRVLRAKDYPAFIFDHGNNHQVHGFPDSDREWSLAGADKRGNSGERSEPTRQCELGDGGCGFVFRPAPVCPNCGRFIPVKGRMVEEVDGELTEVDRTAQRRDEVKQRKQQQGRAKTLEDLIAEGHRRGMKNPTGWARHVMAGRAKKHG